MGERRRGSVTAAGGAVVQANGWWETVRVGAGWTLLGRNSAAGWDAFKRRWTGNNCANMEINQAKRRNGLSVAGLENENSD
jgi:hypothetical protein